MGSITFDARWRGDFGIARYSREIRSRMSGDIHDLAGAPQGFSPRAMAAWEYETFQASRRHPDSILFSPSFTPSKGWQGRQVITVHDLIHLEVPEETDLRKRVYYNTWVRPAIRTNDVTFTVSEYSRQRIAEWAGVDASRIVVTGNAAASTFSPDGPSHEPGYRYLFYVRNAKPHKNSAGLVRAFARLPDQALRLVLTGAADEATVRVATECGVLDRVVFAGSIPDSLLPEYYRGAAVAVFPSFYEGFGIPPIEAMASGTPVVVSNATSLPEVVGDAGVFVDPADAESIAQGIQSVLSDAALSDRLRRLGLERAKHYSWSRFADVVSSTLANL